MSAVVGSSDISKEKEGGRQTDEKKSARPDTDHEAEDRVQGEYSFQTTLVMLLMQTELIEPRSVLHTIEYCIL